MGFSQTGLSGCSCFAKFREKGVIVCPFHEEKKKNKYYPHKKTKCGDIAGVEKQRRRKDFFSGGGGGGRHSLSYAPGEGMYVRVTVCLCVHVSLCLCLCVSLSVCVCVCVCVCP